MKTIIAHNYKSTKLSTHITNFYKHIITGVKKSFMSYLSGGFSYGLKTDCKDGSLKLLDNSFNTQSTPDDFSRDIGIENTQLSSDPSNEDTTDDTFLRDIDDFGNFRGTTRLRFDFLFPISRKNSIAQYQ